MGPLIFICVTTLSFFICGPMTVRSDSCQCAVNHPQQLFCQDEFVILVEFADAGSASPLPGKPDYGYSMNSYYKYNATVLEIYKDTADGTIQEGDQIDIWTPKSFCGRMDLVYLKDYVVGGQHKSHENPETGEVMDLYQIAKCHMALDYDEMTEEQTEGIEGVYEAACKSCNVHGVYSIMSLPAHYQGKTHHGAISNIWSPYHQCFFNPLASAHNQVIDCETMFSTCRHDESGECTWDMNDEYMKCFDNREKTMSYQEGAAAVTKASDCKKLQYKRLKRKCLRQFKKMKKEQRGITMY